MQIIHDDQDWHLMSCNPLHSHRYNIKKLKMGFSIVQLNKTTKTKFLKYTS